MSSIVTAIHDRDWSAGGYESRSPAHLIDPLFYMQVAVDFYKDKIATNPKLKTITTIAIGALATCVLIASIQAVPLYGAGVKLAADSLVFQGSFGSFCLVMDSVRAFFGICSTVVISWKVCGWVYRQLPSVGGVLPLRMRGLRLGESSDKLGSLTTDIQTFHTKWNTKVTKKKIETCKAEAQEICKNFCAVISSIRKTDKEGDLYTRFQKPVDQLRDILEEIAALEEAEDAIDHTPVSVLGRYRISNDMLSSLLRRLEWNVEKDFIFLDLKMMEKGIFSIMQLKQHFVTKPGSSSLDIEAILDSVAGHLDLIAAESSSTPIASTPTIASPRGRRRLLAAYENLKQVAWKVDNVVAPIFANTFKVLCFIADISSIKSGQFFAGMMWGMIGHTFNRSTERFVGGSALTRLLWLENCLPWVAYGNALGTILAQGRLRAARFREFY